MSIPNHIAKLREKTGHDLMLLPGVCALVLNDKGEILLQRRADSGRWGLPGGIMEPGEVPATAVVREVFEETGVTVVPERITGVYTTPLLTYSNGDRAQYVIVGFACRPVGGVARVNDDESLEVAYFPLDALPELHPAHRARIKDACAGGAPWFAPPGASVSLVE